MLSNEELDSALLDVRRAYRLLGIYQRHVLDLCTELAEVFNKELTFYAWAPGQSLLPPGKGKSPISHVTWDFLPLYDFLVLYLLDVANNEEHHRGDWMLVVRMCADSAYKYVKGTESDARDFADPTTCASVARLYLYYCNEDFGAPWFSGVYDANDYPPNEGRHDLKDKRVSTYSKTFPLSELGDAAAVQRQVEIYRGELSKVFPRAKW